jgi:hypothetical protein
MALKLTKSTVHGFVADSAYHRVENVRINPKQAYEFEGSSSGPVFMMIFSLRAYRQNDGSPFFAESQHSCTYNIEGSNPIAQAYEYLKKLPEFSASVDC